MLKKYSKLLSVMLLLLFVQQAVITNAQSKIEVKSDQYTKQVEVLVKNKQIKEAFAIIDNLEDRKSVV